MRRLSTTALAAGAVMLFAATAASAAQFDAGANPGVSVSGVGILAQQRAMVGARAAVGPPGFHHGRKVGWHGGHVPPGWSHGRKVGWHHGSMPPGLRKR